MSNKWKSRKFWMAVVAALITIGNDGLGLNLPSESIMSIAGVAIAYIFGEAYVDSKK
ncbi:hypothetical protein L1765_13885 [Microaerobacter geothermalis]|uniref:hypothetical protein n=1 Tax=Microaerobacter geothermalis TaxID=674972 RepID=UPI001F4000EC|nr:hypothetical protein [Microaerobacter geothermalis]MCF6095049.1 hypothetical protein [Microaerobacter geothermalis]